MYPKIKYKLKAAHMDISPHDFMKKTLKNAFFSSIMFTILGFFMLDKMEQPMILLVFVFIVVFYMSFSLSMLSPDGKIRRREIEIDKDVLFAGRFLLIKIRSGTPLLNAIVDASKSYGVAGKYFKEIVNDIELGTTLEDALTTAMKTTPSKKFKKILFQVVNALKIGVDVTGSLEAVLKDITNSEFVEIKRYGKKLNGITMFYMLIAVVFPSLGMTMFIVVASLTASNIGLPILLSIAFFLAILQFMFITLFKSIRPKVNI